MRNLGPSSYLISSLANTLNTAAPNSRRFVFLDACFAGAAAGAFMPQSDAALHMQRDTLEKLADRGTALLCAASSADFAVTPRNGDYTMFSGELLHVLRNGSSHHADKLSLSDVEDLVRGRIIDRFRNDAVKPEIHIPDKRSGDISRIPIFPNKSPLVDIIPEDILDTIQRAYADYRKRRIISQRMFDEMSAYYAPLGEKVKRPAKGTLEAGFLEHVAGRMNLEEVIVSYQRTLREGDEAGRELLQRQFAQATEEVGRLRADFRRQEAEYGAIELKRSELDRELEVTRTALETAESELELCHNARAVQDLTARELQSRLVQADTLLGEARSISEQQARANSSLLADKARIESQLTEALTALEDARLARSMQDTQRDWAQSLERAISRADQTGPTVDPAELRSELESTGRPYPSQPQQSEPTPSLLGEVGSATDRQDRWWPNHLGDAGKSDATRKALERRPFANAHDALPIGVLAAVGASFFAIIKSSSSNGLGDGIALVIGLFLFAIGCFAWYLIHNQDRLGEFPNPHVAFGMLVSIAILLYFLVV